MADEITDFIVRLSQDKQDSRAPSSAKHVWKWLSDNYINNIRDLHDALPVEPGTLVSGPASLPSSEPVHSVHVCALAPNPAFYEARMRELKMAIEMVLDGTGFTAARRCVVQLGDSRTEGIPQQGGLVDISLGWAVPAGDPGNSCLALATLLCGCVAVHLNKMGAEEPMQHLRSLPGYSTLQVMFEMEGAITMDKAFDMLDRAHNHAALHRRPDDFEFRRVLKLLMDRDPTLDVEGAIAAWQKRQSGDIFKRQRKLKGNAAYRMRRMLSETDLSPEALAWMEGIA